MSSGGALSQPAASFHKCVARGQHRLAVISTSGAAQPLQIPVRHWSVPNFDLERQAAGGFTFVSDQTRCPWSTAAHYDARLATNLDTCGPNTSTIKKRASCMAMTKPASTALVAAITATESAPPGLVAR